jgi:hypothetical protein
MSKQSVFKKQLYLKVSNKTNGTRKEIPVPANPATPHKATTEITKLSLQEFLSSSLKK